MRRIWLVRGGRNGEQELEAIEEGKVLLGFTEVHDLRKFKDRDAILAHLEEVMPAASQNALRNFASQLNQFAHRMNIGDLVVMPRKGASTVAMGEVLGEYEYSADSAAKHWRAAKWLNEAVSRDTLKPDLRHSLNALMTVCEITRNAAAERIEEVLRSGRDPGILSGRAGRSPAPTDVVEGEPPDAGLDIESLAKQQIASIVRSEFAGHDLANLVAEILRAEGYRTRLSPPGPDGGVDILAAGGMLGLGEDRICVQVKSGDGTANHDVVLRLLGAVANTQASTGLLVSLAGVNAPAQRELERNFFKLRLWDEDDLVRALCRTYGALDDTTRARIPLKQIWALVPTNKT